MLSCICNYESDEWYYSTPTEFNTCNWKRRPKCCSCKNRIGNNSLCVVFHRYRETRGEVEEHIYGNERRLANWYMCEDCGEIYLNLDSLGYCIQLGDDMRELLKEYQDITGFTTRIKEE